MRRCLVAVLVLLWSPSLLLAEGVLGYYRDPDLHGNIVVFAAEGDLWAVPVTGGVARRLTTHPAEESHPTVSPDGERLAFSANYEGPMEVYTMPLAGGLPTRHTWEEGRSRANTWTPDGRLVYATAQYATLPDLQLVTLDLEGGYERIPLSQASEGTFDASGETLYFVRPAFHRNVTKRYTGGTARRIWKFSSGAEEAVVLTDDYVGESHTPMWWNGRVYFISDRDGTMNLWSMDENGSDVKQQTRHRGWDVRDAALDEGRIVHQVGADLWIHDIGADTTERIEISLASDVDQWREKWVKAPMEYLTSVSLHPEGDSVVLTTRGRLFVAPTEQGRLVRVSRKSGVRYRDAVFMPDGERVLALSDESGELEFVQLPADGVGEQTPLTDNGQILRFQGRPSPDGKWIAYTDHNRDLWLLEIATHNQRVISSNRQGVSGIAWAPDGRWVAFEQGAANDFVQILIYGIDTKDLTPLTSDRVNSWSPAWDPKGEWVYFLSDRELRSLVPSPWGSRQPEPYFDKPDKIYQVALRSGTRSPFRAPDELFEPPEEEDTSDNDKEGPVTVKIEFEGLQERVREVPAAEGNYNALGVNEKALFWMARESGPNPKWHLMALELTSADPEPETLIEDLKFWDLSIDGKKILAHQNDDLFVFDASTSAPSKLADHKLDLSGWTFTIDPRQDWRQIFIDAWRLQRDYFYDPGLHGVDWEGVRDKYLPLVDRVTTRAELSELIGRVMGELSALHMSVRGGDHRQGPDDVTVASLGARLERDEAGGGYRVDYVYRADPDYPDELSPLANPDVGVVAGDVILAINGVAALSVSHIGELLRNQEGKQVRLRIQPQAGAAFRDVMVTPTDDEWSLRYRDWQWTRRQAVEAASGGKIGYVHLQAMGGFNLTEWYRQFYPVFNRAGLILDVRHNDGGNIDSIILEKLLRRAWFFWKGRVEEPYWNMQYAFRGHMVVLCDENTASDGEVFAEGFRRLGLGKVIGTRTWGGEIWLSSTNRLTDRGIARAPMWGTYDDEGNWLIEQHGVDPDIVVDNPPHATFQGEDAQLQTAIDHLLELIEADPRSVPEAPPYPDRSFDYPDP